MPSAMKPLIQQHSVDAKNGVVTLTMPGIDPALAITVLAEIDTLSKLENASAYSTAIESDNLTVTIQNKDIALLARDVTKLMTRRVAELEEDNTVGKRGKYASLGDINTVLGTLKEHAQKQSPYVGRVIDAMLAAARQVEMN